jgi:hypothetical protein
VTWKELKGQLLPSKETLTPMGYSIFASTSPNFMLMLLGKEVDLLPSTGGTLAEMN